MVVLIGLFCAAPDIRGTFRHCDVQYGDETTAVFHDDDDNVSLLFIRGGCLGADVCLSLSL
jgi:hypothetical protein